jgi:3-deoxy-manno-octulosonate cytidylyltransferase (CMP-KDO synthetase)
MAIAILIPARMASVRFPGKPLVDLEGKPMIQWVWERARMALPAAEVVIATPDREILRAAESFGAAVALTRDDHPSGTDRLAEVAADHPADVFLNVQGDEPLIDPESIRNLAGAFDDTEVQMASVWVPCPEEEIEDPSVVKVVTNLAGDALYFSRYALPFPRQPRPEVPRKHLGLYGYRRGPLLAFADWPVTPLEATEGLEQLRFLEHGVKIRMILGKSSGIAIDLPAHAEKVRAILRES